MSILKKMEDYALKHIKELSSEQVLRICYDNDFNEAKIEVALSKYLTDSKYVGLEQYEW
jgi:hypothetical protein